MPHFVFIKKGEIACRGQFMKKIITVLMSLALLCNQYGFNTYAEENNYGNDSEISGDTNNSNISEQTQSEEEPDIVDITNEDSVSQESEKIKDDNEDNAEPESEIIDSSNNEIKYNEDIAIDLLYGTNHSQQEAVEWIKARKAEGWAENYDGKGPAEAQCVDLIAYYFDYLVGYHLSGNGYDYYGRDDLPEGWVYNSEPQPGDIAVWQAYHGFALQYGHVALVESVGVGSFDYVDVNGETGAGGSGSVSNSNASTFIHPDFSSPVPDPDPDPEPEEIPYSCEYELAGGNTVIMTKCTGNAKTLEVPSRIHWAAGGGPVIGIAAEVFSNNINLETVIIPEGITTIGADAFRGCSNLTSITLPSTLESVEMQRIGADGLKTVGPIGSGANVQINFPAVFTSAYNEFMEDAEQIVVPEGVTQLGDNCFRGLPFNSISLPNSLTYIGYCSFYDTEIESITIPTNVKQIETFAFGYSKLKKIIIPYGSKLERTGEKVFYGNEYLQSAGGIGSGADIEIGYGETVPAFCGGLYYNVKEVTIPSGVKSIGASAFYPSDLRKLRIPASVQTIGEDVISSNYLKTVGPIGSGKDIEIEFSDKIPSSFKNLFKYVNEVIISDKVTTIEDHSFDNCYALNHLVVPSSVTTVGSAFQSCEGLKTVGRIGSGENIEIEFGDTFPAKYSYHLQNRDYGYKGLFSNLRTVILPDDVKIVEDYAFDNAYLQRIVFPEGIENFGSGYRGFSRRYTYEPYAELPVTCGPIGSNSSIEIPFGSTFSGRKISSVKSTNLFDSIEAITIPDNVTRIGENALSSCGQLAEITIPTSVTSIGENAFSHCASLESVIIPSSVKYIGGGAFGYCDNLSKAVFESNDIEFKDDVLGHYSGSIFKESNKLKTVGGLGSGCDIEFPFPEKLIHDYRYLYESAETVIIPENVTTIDHQAFQECEGLKYISIPNTVTTIAAYGLFNGCTNLERVSLPYGITDIGTQMFYNCTSLKEVSIPATIKTIQGYAFENCTSLESFSSDTVTFISNRAFAGCTGLKEVNIPNGFGVGQSAFEGCTSLEKVNLITSLNTDAFKNCTSLKEIHLSRIMNIPDNTFANCPGNMTVYFNGTENIWKVVNFNEGNDALKTATVIFNTDSRLVLGKTVLNLASGDTETIIAYVSYAQQQPTIVWSTDNENVATVDQNGNVTAVNGGAAVITARTEDGTKSATCTVKVTSNKIKLTVKAEDGTVLDGTGEYNANTIVTVTAAETRDNKEFIKWSSSEQLSYVDSTRADRTLSFIMPAQEVDLVVLYGNKETVSNVTATIKSLGTNPSTVAIYPSGTSLTAIESDIKTGAEQSVDTGDNTSSSGNTKEYEIPALEAGTYQIAVYKPGYLLKVQEITVTDSDVNTGDIKLRAYGDSTGDNKVDVSDIIKIRDIILGDQTTIESLDDESKEASNVNGDKGTDVSDIILVRDRILGVVGEDYQKTNN